MKNAQVTGHLPHERARLETAAQELDWIDAFREDDSAPTRYTWCSNWRGAFENNLGWRIDLQLVTPDLRDTVLAAAIYTGERFSDHAPLTIEYDLQFGRT